MASRLKVLLFDIEAKIVRVTRFWLVSPVLTVAIHALCAPSKSVQACCRAFTALPCSHVVKHRPWLWPHWAQSKTAQRIDALTGDFRDTFLFHYNMPPFATGETGRVGTPKRREIGHGRLAKRALVPLLPPKEDFAYTVRVVSPKSLNPTARRRWLPFAVVAWP
jgi:hypothetical protein